MGPSYNEFGYNDHAAETTRFLCIKTINVNIQTFGFGFTRCKRDPAFALFVKRVHIALWIGDSFPTGGDKIIFGYGSIYR